MKQHLSAFFRSFVPVLILAVPVGVIGASDAFAVTTSTATAKHHKKKKAAATTSNTLVVKPLVAKPVVATPVIARTARGVVRKKAVWVQTWDEPTYKDSTISDKVDGEDLNVRKAAVDALGPLNGSVVVADPTTGRILTMVNQPLALGGGFQPCSTIKVSVALAALREGLVEKTSPARFFSKRESAKDLTDALAFSKDEHLLLAADAHSGDVAVIRTESSQGRPALFTILPAGISPNSIAVKATEKRP